MSVYKPVPGSKSNQGEQGTQLESFIVSIGNRIEAIAGEATSSRETKAGSKRRGREGGRNEGAAERNGEMEREGVSSECCNLRAMCLSTLRDAYCASFSSPLIFISCTLHACCFAYGFAPLLQSSSK